MLTPAKSNTDSRCCGLAAIVIGQAWCLRLEETGSASAMPQRHQVRSNSYCTSTILESRWTQVAMTAGEIVANVTQALVESIR